jgi:flavin-dependent dehydrogenase
MNHDVVIVGGGPAGLATALFLCHADPSRRGRVVVLEKERYPRDKFCGGGIGARADQALLRIGVSVDVPSVPIDGISVELAHGTMCVRAEPIGRVVRRIEYDHALARAAASRGVCIVEGAQVTGIRVAAEGVAVDSTAGAFRGRILVGADGVGSVVRRAMGLTPGALRAQVIELDTEPVPGDKDRGILHFDLSRGDLTGYAWDFPTLVGGEPLVSRGVYHLKTDERDVDIRALLAARLAERGLDIGRYRIKRFAERGFERHQPYAAPRVLLVGEAAGIDAFTGEGIAQAIGYGAFAGRYLAEKLAYRDFSFTDFTRRLARSDVGVETRIRARILPHFFGPRRAALERFALSSPALVTLGMEHFAGRHLSRLKLAHVALSAAWNTARARPPVPSTARPAGLRRAS